jgi:hypothetical protein
VVDLSAATRHEDDGPEAGRTSRAPNPSPKRNILACSSTIYVPIFPHASSPISPTSFQPPAMGPTCHRLPFYLPHPSLSPTTPPTPAAPSSLLSPPLPHLPPPPLPTAALRRSSLRVARWPDATPARCRG